MSRLITSGLLLAALSVSAAPASAGDFKLTMQDGRVTLTADNVPVRQILTEWQRIGQTQIVNLDRLSGAVVTLQLVNTPERDALDILLRSANGYIAAPRTVPVAGAATYDRITIFVSTTKAPTQQVAAAPPPTFQRPPMPDESDEPINVQVAPQMVNPVNGQMPMPPQLPPQLQQQLLQQQQQLMQQQQQPTFSPTPGAITSPRPGALPQPVTPNGIPNPYQPVPPRPGGGGD